MNHIRDLSKNTKTFYIPILIMKFNSIKTFFIKAYNKIVAVFKQGLEPIQVFKSILVALLFTIIPLPGTTTILLTTIALKAKLNLPIMITFSYLITPLQYVLLMPFIKVGETIFSTHHTLYSVQAIMSSFENGFFNTLQKLTFEIICGIAGWVVIAIPVAFLLYYIGYFLFFKKHLSNPVK